MEALLKECLDIVTRRLKQDGQGQRSSDHDDFLRTGAMSEELQAGNGTKVEERQASPEEEYLAIVEVGARYENTHERG